MNEPTVDELWRWRKDITIGGRQVWMRTLSATDDSERTKAAMISSRRMRAKLLSESPEREEMNDVYGKIGRTELMAAIRAFRTEEARALVGSEVQPKIDPPEPSDPTLDAAMDAEDAWEEELVDLVKRREAWIQEHVEVIMAKHGEDSDDELREKALAMQISSFCTQAYLEEFNRQTVFRACHADKKFTRYTFSSAEEAGAVDPRAYATILNEYYELDKFALNAEYLKN